MNNLYDKIQKEIALLDTVYIKLLDLADAFSVTGNEKMSDNLSRLVDDIISATVGIEKAISLEITSQFNESQKRLLETLNLLVKKSIEYDGGKDD